MIAALKRFWAPQPAVQQDDYDGAETSTNRKTRATSLKSEDRHLPPEKRRALVSRTSKTLSPSRPPSPIPSACPRGTGLQTRHSYAHSLQISGISCGWSVLSNEASTSRLRLVIPSPCPLCPLWWSVLLFMGSVHGVRASVANSSQPSFPFSRSTTRCSRPPRPAVPRG